MISFIVGVFSDNGSPSFSRVAGMIHTLIAVSCLGHVVWHANIIPDAMTLGGLGAFAGVPYALNQVKNAVTSFSAK